MDFLNKFVEDLNNIDLDQLLNLDSMPERPPGIIINEIESQEQFDKLMTVDGEKVIIFGATWCKNCPVLVESIQDNADLRATSQSTITYIKVDSEEFPDISDSYATKALPFSVFINKSGSTVATYAGSEISEFITRLQAFGGLSESAFDTEGGAATTATRDAAASLKPLTESDGAPKQPIVPPLRMVPLRPNVIQPQFPRREMAPTDPTFNSAFTFQMLDNIGLGDVPFAPKDIRNLNNYVHECFSLPEPEDGFTLEDIVNIYTFPQPTVSPDGTCSNIEVMADKRFNLAIDAYKIPGVKFTGSTNSSANAGAATKAGAAASTATLFPDGRRFNCETLMHHPMTLRLYRLKQLVSRIEELTGADWIGIYRMSMASSADVEEGKKEETSSSSSSSTTATTTTIPKKSSTEETVTAATTTTAAATTTKLQAAGGEYPAFLKEAYFGEPSRALFPVTKEFALKSTNSWVGMTGKVRLIRNTTQREEGVAYYQCSGSVRSEVCLPILQKITVFESDSVATTHYQVVGIIDLESWKLNHFTSRMIAELIKIGFDLASIDFGGCPLDVPATA